MLNPSEMTGYITYELPEIVDMNQGDTYEVTMEGLDESFMVYDSESNSIIIDQSKAKFGKYTIEIKIVDALQAKSTSTFDIDI